MEWSGCGKAVKGGWGIVLFVVSSCLILGVAEAGWFSSDKPEKGDIRNSFEMSLSSYLSLEDFEVDILENLGNKVDPRWGSRFKATVRTRVDSYLPEREGEKILFVRLHASKGQSVDVYGKAYSKVYQGGWNHSFEIEGKPIENLGLPLDNYGGKRVVVIGSQEEKHYLEENTGKDDIKTEVVLQSSPEKPEREKKSIDISQNLLGSWDEVCGQWKGNVTYFKKGRIVMETKGKFTNGTWRLSDKGLVVQYEGDREYDWKVVEMTEDGFVIKSGNFTCTAKRVK